MLNLLKFSVAGLVLSSLLLGCESEFNNTPPPLNTNIPPGTLRDCKADWRTAKTIVQTGDFKLQLRDDTDDYNPVYQIARTDENCLFSFTQELDPSFPVPAGGGHPVLLQISKITAPPESVTVRGRDFQRFAASDILARQIILEKFNLCQSNGSFTKDECMKEVRNWISNNTAVLDFKVAGRSTIVSLVGDGVYIEERKLK